MHVLWVVRMGKSRVKVRGTLFYGCGTSVSNEGADASELSHCRLDQRPAGDEHFPPAACLFSRCGSAAAGGTPRWYCWSLVSQSVRSCPAGERVSCPRPATGTRVGGVVRLVYLYLRTRTVSLASFPVITTVYC